MLDKVLKFFKLDDINHDGKNDVEQVTAAVNSLLASAQDAAAKLDYKTIIIHMKSIFEALQAVQFYLQEIQKTINTPEVKQALADLKIAVESFGKLVNSFVEKKA